MKPTEDDSRPAVTPRRWPRSALVRWGYVVGALFYLVTGVVNTISPSDSHMPQWFLLFMAAMFGLLGFLFWREPLFEVTSEGVRWPSSKGVIPWADLRPLTLPPDDGWTHTVFLDAVDGRQQALPKMTRSELEALAQQIRQHRSGDVDQKEAEAGGADGGRH